MTKLHSDYRFEVREDKNGDRHYWLETTTWIKNSGVRRLGFDFGLGFVIAILAIMAAGKGIKLLADVVLRGGI